MMVSNGNLLFQEVIFRRHVSFRESMLQKPLPKCEETVGPPSPPQNAWSELFLGGEFGGTKGIVRRL